MSEVVTVVGDAQPFVETAQVATNFKQDLMATLPSNRTIDAVLLMAPAVHATGPRGAFTINGALSYENLYTAERRGHHREPARAPRIRSTSRTRFRKSPSRPPACRPSTGGSAGGIASAVTKSGGNMFSGSLRTSFANDYWRSLTPFESTQLMRTDAQCSSSTRPCPTYEATFGGPVKKERLWFFGATRIKKQEIDADDGRHQHSVHPRRTTKSDTKGS